MEETGGMVAAERAAVELAAAGKAAAAREAVVTVAGV